MNWFLIFVLVVIAVFTIAGIVKGMVKIVLSLLSIVVTLVLVFMMTPILTSLVKNNTTLYNTLYESVESKIHIESVINIDKQAEAIEQLNIPDVIKDKILENNTLESYAQMGVNSFNAYIVTSLTDIIFSGLIFAVSFLISFIVVKIVFKLLELISKLPGINQVNKLAGGVIGFAEGVLVVWIIMAVITVFGNTEFGIMIFEQINSNELLTFIYNSNLVTKYIIKIA